MSASFEFGEFFFLQILNAGEETILPLLPLLHCGQRFGAVSEMDLLRYIKLRRIS